MPVKKTEKTTEKKAAKTVKADKVEKATKKEIKKTVKKTVKKILKAQAKNGKLLKKAAKPKENAEEKKLVELIVKTLENGKADDVGEDLVGRAATGDGVLVGNHRGLFLLIVVVARRAAVHVHGGVDDSGSVDGNVWRLCYALFRASRIRFW